MSVDERLKEKALETAFEAALLARGWTRGDPRTFDRERALQPPDLFAFVAATQPALWATLRAQHGAGLEAAVLDTLVKRLETHGTLDVLRRGFKLLGKKIEAAVFRPAHGMNPDVLAGYAQNRLVVTRQVRFTPSSEESIDLLLSLNGLPIATVELKNPITGQNVGDAMRQYERRDPRHRLFHFKKRALVHFAVDPDEVQMTTLLDGDRTVFLPFNRGRDKGAGNPEHPSGYRTAYLPEEILERDSFLDVVGRFLHVRTKEEKLPSGKTATREAVVFPRYHQLDAVRKLEAAARAEGAGKSYLVQHSAGSGKSNSIAWLAHRLSSLHDAADRRVFDSVVVVTDRKVLDKQLQDAIYQIEHKQGVVARIDEDSDQLASALSAGVPIIITTLQKFPFVTAKIGELPRRRYALVLDEAHSSQTGEAARHMKEVLAAKTLDEAEAKDAGPGEDMEDQLVQTMESRGRQRNLSFFAFTATPKYKTLHVFGHRDAAGEPVPFHLYTMRQAIEEGFILDVLKNYTTYKAYWKLAQAIGNDPRVPKREAAKALARFVEFSPVNLAAKTEVMIEHFRTSVRHKIGGKAKAMVVTSSRLHAVRYKKAFDKYLKEKGYTDVGVLVAFSGKVVEPDDGLEYTEPGMNRGKDDKPIGERRLPEVFATDDYQVLLVANKYQTGFDQPLLHTMYVDKRLSGLQAVQTLSRLNRKHPGKEDTFVLDFKNEVEEIRGSFKPYYEQTAAAEALDPEELYARQHRLTAMQVFWDSEVEAFCRIFFAPKRDQSAADYAEMLRHLGPAVDRMKALDPDKQDEFRNALGGFVRLYAFLAQIMPFMDPDLEKLYTFCRFLEPKLPRDPKKAPLALTGDVALKYYRLTKISEGSIALTTREPVRLRGPKDIGTRTAKEEETRLSEIIGILNERFGTTFTKADQLFLGEVIEEAKGDAEVVERAQANAFDNFAISMKPKLEELMLRRLDLDQAFVTRSLNDAEFQDVLFPLVNKRIYEEARGEVQRAAVVDDLGRRLRASADPVDRLAGSLLEARTGKPALTLADALSAAEVAGLDLARGYLALERLESNEAAGILRQYVDYSVTPPRVMATSDMIETLRSRRDLSEAAMHDWTKCVQVVWAPAGYRPTAGGTKT